MDIKSGSPIEKRAWWPLFSRAKPIAGTRSIIGWLDDWRPTRTLGSAAAVAPSRSAPREEAIERPKQAEIVPIAPPRTKAPTPAIEPVVPAPPEPIAPPVQQAVPPAAPEVKPAKRESVFSRLKRGLARSAESLSGGITQIFSSRHIDETTLEELEDLLIGSDLGVGAAGRLTAALRASRIDGDGSGTEIKTLLAGEVERVLKPAQRKFAIEPGHKPHVVLIVGVNGTGKTTTIGKLAHQLKGEGKSVMIAAGDTFRAAAIEQLKVWGERVGAEVIARDVGGDAAGLAFDALEKAKTAGTDVLLIDTAGRLQNKTELMAELEKITRVLKKLDPSAPHSVIQVLDATTGQNAIAQVEAFQKTAGVTGLIMTKLDGTARGGILVPLTEKFGLPIYAIGVGEGVEDLQPFDAALFARALAGLEEAA